jgi:hypothetical protein
MPSFIKSIETFDNPDYWVGHKFIMSDSSMDITCKMENSHKCCEKWGVYTESNLNEFIGAEYYSLDVVEKNTDKYDYMYMVTLTINTSKGKIIIYFYNEHNGYYSHDVFIQSNSCIKTISL